MAKDQKIKIYTRTGDHGETSLIFGTRVKKYHPRVVAYGTIDELNATLGFAGSFIKGKIIKNLLQNIQNELFNIGAELASPKKLKKTLPAGRQGTRGFYQLGQLKVQELENIIDQYDKRLPALHTFILPSGTTAAAVLHLARTVSRRAEREVVTLARKEKINPNILSYLNRLSDLLFVLSRSLNKKSHKKEMPWKKD